LRDFNKLWLHITITCQPIMALELHKGSFTIIGRHSNLIKNYYYLSQRKSLIINYNLSSLFLIIIIDKINNERGVE